MEVVLNNNLDSYWDDFVYKQPSGSLYHLSHWRDIIKTAYGHKSYYLIVVDSTDYNSKSQPADSKPTSKSSLISLRKPNISNQTKQPVEIKELSTKRILGILPLVYIRHMLFGNSLVSMPFFDYTGVLAVNAEAQNFLLNEAFKIAKSIHAEKIELRHAKPIFNISKSEAGLCRNLKVHEAKTSKIRMVLELPDSAEKLMQSFKSKLRSQIKRPLKAGLTAVVGGRELLEDFYHVFSINMRDLGSPVHSKHFVYKVSEAFLDSARIVVVYLKKKPVACSLIIGSKDMLYNPWASSLRKYSRLSPNMLLYWKMLEYGCEHGYHEFDFGRSTPGEGTYKFKEQWGAKPKQLHWYFIYPNGKAKSVNHNAKSKFDIAIKYWQKLPVPVTRVIGPLIRKYISL